MNSKFIPLSCIVAVLVAIFIWLYHMGEKPKMASMVEGSSSNAHTVENTLEPSVDMPPANTNISESLPTGQTALPANNIAAEQKARATIEAQNIPFDFYGKAIDQDSNALPDVNFDIWARHWDPDSTAPIHLTRKTDSNGKFDIHGITGDAFDIRSVGKEGYELEPGQLGFGAVGGSIESPIIFKMWSTNIHEQLITGGNKFHIVPDGRLYVIDLAKGTIAETGDGDLKVWVKRPAQITYGKRYDWSCEMDVVNGGLLAAADASMYLAPTDGYTPTFKF